MPDEAQYDAAREKARASLAADAPAEAERRQAEFSARQKQQTYMRTESGWSIVDAFRVSRGPREGEEWFSYEEFMKIRAEEAAAK